MSRGAVAELIEQESARHPAQQAAPDGPRAAPDDAANRPAAVSARLADPGWQGRGNAPARAGALQALQQVYGNRAVQRLLARGLPARMNTDLQRQPEGNHLDDEQQ